MRLPPQKRILREDVKGAPSWINPVIDILNSFMENTYQALNRNITFSENIGCAIKELTYKTPSTYPSGLEDMEFISGLKSKATGVILMQVVDKDLYLPPPGPVYVPWVENNGSIVISTVTGLEADKTYLIRLLVT
jgi:hypothetical protein